MYAVYVGGLFEDKNTPLFKILKKELKKQKVGLFGVFPFETKTVGTSSPAEVLINQTKGFSRDVKYITHSIGSYLTVQTLKPKNCILLDPSLEPQKVFASLGFKQEDQERNRSKHSTLASADFKKFVATSPSIKQICKSYSFNHLTIIGAEKGGHRIAKDYYRHCKKSPAKKMLYIRNASHDMSRNGDFGKIVTIIKKQVDVFPPASLSISILPQQKISKRLSNGQIRKFFNPKPVTL